jgi:predicted permease
MNRPPRTADRVIRGSVARDVVARTIIGDLHEEFAEVARHRPVIIAMAWYWLQALCIGARYGFGLRGRGSAVTASPPAGAAWAGDFLLDARYAARGLRRSPGLTVVIVVTLALAIGVTATMFGIVDRLLLSAPPYIVEPREVVRLSVQMTGFNGEPFVMQAAPYALYQDLARRTRLFDGWAAAASRDAALGTGESATRVAVSGVSGNYFALLGAEPLLGRFLNDGDDQPPLGGPTVVISHGMWQRRFGGDPAALGEQILVDGRPRAVVGVAPPGFTGDGVAPIDLWMSIHSAFAADDPSWKHDRRRRTVSVIARLGAGTTAAAAQRDADRIVAETSVTPSNDTTPARAVLAPLTPGRGPQGASPQARISLWLVGVAIVVLLVAAANVANLLLLRTEHRRHELAVRLALGMGRGRLIRQLLAESLLLAATGGVAALVVASWAGGLLRASLLPEVAAPPTALSVEVAAAGITATLGAALLAGLFPALYVGARAGDAPPRPGRDLTPAGSKVRSALLLAQTAMSVLLLVGAGLFVTSLRNVQAQDLGMQLEGVLLAEIEFVGELPARDRDATYRNALEKVRKIPRVDTAVAAHTLPFGSFMTVPMGFPGEDFRSLFGGRQLPYFHAVEAAFFDLMGVDILEGRALRVTDDASAAPVVVISESLARYVWPRESAVGKCMRAGMIEMPTPGAFLDGAGADVPCYEIVGVSADVEERSLVAEERLSMQWYTTFEQMPPLPPVMSGGPQIKALLVKTSGDPEAVAAAVQRVMQGSSDRIALVDVRPYRDLIDPRARSWRLGATLFTLFAALALAIATVGMYGVSAHAVTQRTREMGVRMALGARRIDVACLVLGRSLRAVTGGVVVGTLAALWAARYIEALLYETSAANPPVFAAVIVVLIAVASTASIVPALRATRADPRVTLTQP